MNKMHQKFVVPKKKEHNPIRMASISSIPSVPIENSESTDNKEEEIKPVSESESSESSSNAESGDRKIILESPPSSEVTPSSGIKKITLEIKLK